ncbi:MAG: PH domain-containing protein [Chitinophagaceae bacterium]
MAYALREHDVIYQKGWLVKSTKVCPFNRVQNCSIQSGPLERRWGLASLVLYTAGSEGADMRIPGLLQNDAESLRQFILSKINGTGKI